MESGEAHQELRRLLFSIAYRMVGSVSEAEDEASRQHRDELARRFFAAVEEGG